MTRGEIASTGGSVAKAGNDDLALLLSQVSHSLVDAVRVDNAAAARIDSKHNTTDIIVLTGLP